MSCFCRSFSSHGEPRMSPAAALCIVVSLDYRCGVIITDSITFPTLIVSVGERGGEEEV